MNRYDMTLKQLNHDKNLHEYQLDHPTKDQVLCIHLYDTRKLDDYTPNELTVMLRHEIEPEVLVPLALEVLAENLFYKAGSFAGDLLAAISIQNLRYWQANPDQKKDLVKLIQIFEDRLNLAKYHMKLIDYDTWLEIKKD